MLTKSKLYDALPEVAPEYLDCITGGAGGTSTPPPKPPPMPPSTQCWSTRDGSLACMSEGDVKVM
jgi:hypothetical protein